MIWYMAERRGASPMPPAPIPPSLPMPPSIGHRLPNTIHVEPLTACSLQPFHHDLSNALDEFVAEIMGLSALGTQADAIEGDCPHRLNDTCAEMPAVRREKPGPAQYLACLDRLDSN